LSLSDVFFQALNAPKLVFGAPLGELTDALSDLLDDWGGWHPLWWLDLGAFCAGLGCQAPNTNSWLRLCACLHYWLASL